MQEMSRRFAREEVAPQAAHYDKTGEVEIFLINHDLPVRQLFWIHFEKLIIVQLFFLFSFSPFQYPIPIIKKMFDNGMLNAHIPKEYG